MGPDIETVRSAPAMLDGLGALAIALTLLAGSLLWLRFGETIYVERILGALAGCF